MVPFHALPKLHDRVQSEMPHTYSGLLEAFKEIVPTLIRQSKDATYFVLRELPQTNATELLPPGEASGSVAASSGGTHYA